MEKDRSRVSIIIPNYNGKECLERLLRLLREDEKRKIREIARKTSL